MQRPKTTKNPDKSTGFTLIELMIVVAIIAIVGSFAGSMYTSQVKKAYRADAKSALVQLAGEMERYRTENNTYADAALAGGTGTVIFTATAPVQSNTPIYNLTLSDLGANTYTLTATPISGARMDGDGVYTLAHTGATTYSGTVNDDWK